MYPTKQTVGTFSTLWVDSYRSPRHLRLLNCTYKVRQKVIPVVFFNRLEIFDETLPLHSLFILTYKCQILHRDHLS